MGGQACAFYGAAQICKDVDYLVLADKANFDSRIAALDKLGAVRIAAPPSANNGSRRRWR